SCSSARTASPARSSRRLSPGFRFRLPLPHNADFWRLAKRKIRGVGRRDRKPWGSGLRWVPWRLRRATPGEALQRQHLAHPLHFWLCGKTSPDRARRHIVVDSRARGGDCTLAHSDMRNDAGPRPEHDKILERNAAAQARLRNDDAMLADDTIVSDLTEIVDLGAIANDRIAHAAAIDPRARSDFDVVMD